MWGPDLALGAGNGQTCYTCDLCVFCFFSISIHKDRAHVWFPTFVDPAGRDTRAGPSPVSLLFPCSSYLPCPLLQLVFFFFFLCLYGQPGRGWLSGVGPPHLLPPLIDSVIPPRPEISHNQVWILGLVAVEVGKFDIICDLCVNLIVNYDKYIEFEYNQSHIHGY